jgi:hypothetical protein
VLSTTIIYDPYAALLWWLTVPAAFVLGTLVGAGVALRIAAWRTGLRPEATARVGAVLVATGLVGLVVSTSWMWTPLLPAMPYPPPSATPDRTGWRTPPWGYPYPSP